MRAGFSTAFLALCFAAMVAACGTPPGGRGGPDGPGEQRGGNCKAPADQLRDQLSETAQSLNLSPKQRVLWEKYEESVSGLMADQLRLSPYQAPNRTAVQQINAKVDNVRNRLAAMEELSERAGTLYQSLDERQKKVADQRLSGTVPALYSGLVCSGAGAGGGERGGPGQGGPGGGMGRF